jgi:hypothetical protein
MSEPQFRDFGSSENLLVFIKEKSEDIEKAVIPQFLGLTIKKAGTPIGNYEVGMILHMIDGTRKLLTPEDAEIVLNDGILARMKIRIELFRGQA